MSLLCEYQKMNESFGKELVFKLGIGGGFFSEYNNMIVSMLYCLQHGIQFKLNTINANFSIEKGWCDFFEPFCEEVDDNRVHFKTVDWRYLVKSIFRRENISLKDNILPYLKFWSKSFLTQDVFGKARSSVAQNYFYDIPALGIHGDFRNACGVLLKMTWCYNQIVKSEIDEIIQELNLPLEYISLQIRGGDKVLEHQIFSVDEYFNRIENHSIKNAFILTDDYEIYEKCQIEYPNWHFWTLCERSDKGYNNTEFVKQNSATKKRKLIRLFAAMEIMTSSIQFIGTYTANPGLFLGMRIPEKTVSIDQEWKIW